MPKKKAPPPPPPPPRRSSLRRRSASKQSYKEPKDDDDDDDDLNIADWIGKNKIKQEDDASGGEDNIVPEEKVEKKPAAKQKETNKPAAQTRKRKTSESDDDDDHDEPKASKEATKLNEQDDEESNSSTSHAAKPATKKQKPFPKTCPHCNKTYGTVTGAKYHVQNFVCRPAERPVPVKRRGKSSANEKGDEKGAKQARGQLKDRICPNCNRVFTSVFGLKYHRDHSVCDNSLKQANSVPFPTLKAGQMFATKFGVVEVVRDDRATPTAVLPPDIKPKLYLYNNNVVKRDARIRKEIANVAVETRVRSKLLQRAHEAGNVNQQTIADAYQRSVLPIPPIQRVSAEALRKEREGLKDPSAPEDSYPDRIVECVMRPDRRPRYVGEDKNDVLEGLAEEEEQNTVPPVKMFLARRLLTTPYCEDNPRYHCPKCWKCCSSKPGLSHHMAKQTCTKRAEKEAKGKKTQEETIQKRSEQALARIDFQATIMRSAPKAKKKTVKVSEAGAKKTLVKEEAPPAAKAAKKKAPVLSEPEDFRGPDGKFRGPRIKRTGDTDEEDFQPEKPAAGAKKKKKKKRAPMKGLPPDVANDVVHPDDILAELEQELAQLQGQMLGSMYPGVWDSLGYKKPTVKKTKKRKKAKDGNARKRHKQAVVEEPATPPPDPLDQTVSDSAVREIVPIIDTRVLAAEVDSGRYPSIKRYHGDHDARCAICKSDKAPVEILGINDRAVACNFCRQIVHLSCASFRFSVKDPEPDDDFMCHRCMGVVASRRLRAEKRRLEKLHPDVEDAVALEEARMQEERELLHGLVPGREFECVAVQGRQVEDLSELLREAKSRLSLSNEMASMNRWRLNLLEDYAKDVKK